MMKPMKREDVTDLIVFRKMKAGINAPDRESGRQSKEWTAGGLPRSDADVREAGAGLGKPSICPKSRCCSCNRCLQGLAAYRCAHRPADLPASMSW